jgi:preprotein translocase subunit SecF
MFVIKYKKIFFVISLVLVLASVGSLVFLGLDFGIDFTGGSIAEVRYVDEIVDQGTLKQVFDESNIGEYSLRRTGEKGYILRTSALKEGDVNNLISIFSLNHTRQVEVDKVSSIGPVIGEELKRKAYVAIITVIIAIILFIAYVFRNVSQRNEGDVSSWKYGLAAIIALIHDIIIPTGVFSVLSYMGIVQVDILFVSALLAILGFSVNDTIVVFDRIRENLRLDSGKTSFENIVGRSLSQTYTRSINTSLTVLFVLLTMFFLGGPSIHFFSLTLIVGIVAGTYSSIFLASPLLVSLAKRK